MVSKALVGVGAAVALLVGCGSARSVAVPEPAPPLRALDAPLPSQLRRVLDLSVGIALPNQSAGQSELSVICVSTANGKRRSCTAGNAAQQGERLARWQHDLRPARGETPRLVAELGLRGGRSELLAAWWTRLGSLCLMTGQRPFDVRVSRPFGPCAVAADRDSGQPVAPLDRCDAICLTSTGGGSSPDRIGYTLAGLVAPRASALEVTLAGGSVRVYPLRGPILRRSGRRVFMADLGARDWRRLELLRSGTVLASRTMPTELAAVEDCQTEYGASGSSVTACMRRATGGAFPP